MLIPLLRTYLRRYKTELVLVLILQAAQTIAALYLPTLNADIIDHGVLTGNSHYIWSKGVLMILITLVQISCATAAVYFGSKAAMGFGRDVRSGMFHQVTDYSAREMNEFGAPSLITRITNDVQQVQMLVLMTCTLLVAAPITAIGGVVLAIREDGGLSWILTVSIPVLVIAILSVVSRMVPQFRVMQERIDRVNQVLREQITGIRVVRAFVREPAEAERFGEVNGSLTNTALLAGRLQAFMFPTVLLVLNCSSVAVLWFGSGRIDKGQVQIGSLIAFLSYLAQIIMAVMMATFMVVLVPRAAVCAERISEVLDTPSSVVRAKTPVTELHTTGTLELRNVGFHYPGAEAPV
ncbi:MAG TPA: ABC transporter permease, partial [Ilumatobacteraceae bacterium]